MQVSDLTSHRLSMKHLSRPITYPVASGRFVLRAPRSQEEGELYQAVAEDNSKRTALTAVVKLSLCHV